MVTVLRLADKLLFQGLTPIQLERVSEIVKVREAAPGETIIKERDYGEALYVLDEGRVEVRSGATKVAEIRAPREGEISKAGDFFGEMCLLDLEPRCATVVAIEKCTLWEINRDDLYWLFGDDKELQLRILLTVARVLSRRLVGTPQGRARGESSR